MAVKSPGEMVKEKQKLEKAETLETLQAALELPMVILSFILLVLFIIELSVDLPNEWLRIFNLVNWFIWTAFVIEYVVKLSLAPDTVGFVKENWLMGLAIVLPFFRVLRVFRAARAIRSLGTLRVITVGNRTISKLQILFERRRLQYVLAVVVLMNFLSAAGIYFLERNEPGANIRSYGDGLWWAAGIITTVGTEKYPITAEGRILAVIGMVFGVSVFTYLAGSLASFFIKVDTADDQEEKAVEGPDGDSKLIELTEQIRTLEERIQTLHQAQTRRR